MYTRILNELQIREKYFLNKFQSLCLMRNPVNTLCADFANSSTTTVEWPRHLNHTRSPRAHATTADPDTLLSDDTPISSNISAKKNKNRARPGFEPGTSRTLSENHTPRPTSRRHLSLPGKSMGRLSCRNDETVTIDRFSSITSTSVMASPIAHRVKVNE